MKSGLRRGREPKSVINVFDLKNILFVYNDKTKGILATCCYAANIEFCIDVLR